MSANARTSPDSTQRGALRPARGDGAGTRPAAGPSLPTCDTMTEGANRRGGAISGAGPAGGANLAAFVNALKGFAIAATPGGGGDTVAGTGRFNDPAQSIILPIFQTVESGLPKRHGTCRLFDRIRVRTEGKEHRAMRAMGAGIMMLILGSGAGFAQGYPIAGTAPDRRPEGAPKITQYAPGRAEAERYLHGVAQPAPPNILANLKSQGGWYTPFDRPGMTPPYDPRGWHARVGGK